MTPLDIRRETLPGKEYYLDISSGEKVYLTKEEWDYLIILDACRYDHFFYYYLKFLKKRLSNIRHYLRKMKSPASMTIEWAKKVFKEKHEDIVYVSANPWINSKTAIAGFNAAKRFYKVIDVWEKGWDPKLGTTPPWKVNPYAIIASRLYGKKGKRLIIHYMQPHAPYIVLNTISLKDLHRIGAANPLSQNNGSPPSRQALGRLGNRASRAFFWSRLKIADIAAKKEGELTGKITYQFLEIIGKATYRVSQVESNPLTILGATIGVNALRKAYKHNLLLVLRSLLKLLPNLRGRIIVTADHGELLGELYLFDHPPGLEIPVLRIVPWLEIEY